MFLELHTPHIPGMDNMETLPLDFHPAEPLPSAPGSPKLSGEVHDGEVHAPADSSLGSSITRPEVLDSLQPISPKEQRQLLPKRKARAKKAAETKKEEESDGKGAEASKPEPKT